MEWEPFWNAFQEQLTVSPATKRCYRDVRRRTESFCERHQIALPASFTASHFALFCEEQYALAGAPRTHHNCICALRQLLLWGYRQDLLLFNPTADYRRPYPSSSVRKRISMLEMAKLLEIPGSSLVDRRDRVLLEFLYGTGLRRSECSAVQLEHLDLQNSQLRVVQGKGKKDRLLPLGKRLLINLQDYLASTRPAFEPSAEQRALFLNLKGGRLEGWQLALIVAQRAKAAGFDGLTAHGIRHSFAVHLLQNGAPLWAVQNLLGHDSSVTTQVYTQLLPEELQLTYRRTHPRARRR